MRFELHAWFLLSWLAGGSVAAEPLTPERAVARRQLTELQVSPDGARAVVVVHEPPEGQKQRSTLWMVDLSSRAVWQLTASSSVDEHPRFSPDGESILFVSNRGETKSTQVYVISLRGGEARAITGSETDVSSPEWAPDGRSIAFLASIPLSPEEKKRKDEDKDDARVVDLEDRPPQLWLLDVASGATRRLTDGTWRIAELVWNARGDGLLLAASDDPRPELFTNRLYRLGLEGGVPVELARPSGPFGNLKISPDGTTLAFVGSRTDGPDGHDLHVLPLDAASGRPPSDLTGASIDRPVDEFQWQGSDTLVAEVEDGFTSRFVTVALDGSATARAGFPKTHPLGSFALAAPGYVFVGESPTVLPEVWLSSSPGKAEALTELNRGLAGIDLVEPSVVSYSSFDGRTIEAGLLRPPGGQPAPAVILVHGGPTGRWSARFQDWGQLLVAKGIAVLYPNVRGSTGYGMDFLAANRRDWGGADFQDVLAGARYLVETGVADADRLGIGGWSYGGYMAAWAVTQTDRFRASVAGAPMTNLVSEYGTEMSAINSYDTWFLGNPYENLDLFRDRSPLTHVRAAETPTLILCGENDVTDPVGQCTELYRGLRRYRTDAELVLYPREGHGFREQKHREDVLRRVVDWFDRNLAARTPPNTGR
jgi:dipeptidyl aminopeptidase/acylaminoacyl peptidase